MAVSRNMPCSDTWWTVIPTKGAAVAESPIIQ